MSESERDDPNADGRRPRGQMFGCSVCHGPVVDESGDYLPGCRFVVVDPETGAGWLRCAAHADSPQPKPGGVDA